MTSPSKQQKAAIDKAADYALNTYKGPTNTLEQAIGALHVAVSFGWKPLYLMHDKKTLRNFEKILDVSFRDLCDEEGPLASRSKAWRLFQKYNNFWKAVSGAIKGVRTNEIDK